MSVVGVMMDHDLDRNAKPIRKTEPDFERELFVGYREEDGITLNMRRVLRVVNECPDEAVFASMRQGVFVQVRPMRVDEAERPGRFLILYDGRTERIYAIDEGAPPEAFGGG